MATQPPYTIFMLSPANLGGERAALLYNPNASFPLARQLQSSEGAPLGELFSFVSGLYFRGKMTYALAFAKAPEGLSGSLVISAGAGLRFLHEPVSMERLRSWKDVDIDERNPRFTEPLVAHATALRDALGDMARFVLLGSVATDKYVRPLLDVFGEQLLFPPDFIGRGDMSRGGLLLRAARARRELEYAPVARADRHGRRPARLSPISADETRVRGPELVVLVGLPGAGKSTFYRQRFGSSHLHVSKDNMPNRQRREQLQIELLRHALGEGQSVVVDNTNVSVEQRAGIIGEARRLGARVVGYYFECTTQECVNRNFGRQGHARIPLVGIFAAAKRLAPPSHAEGFDELHTVRPLPGERFEVTRMTAVREAPLLAPRA
jgi:predicted kinase